MAYVTKSPWVVHYDGSSCNGCDIEVLACLMPMYDVERFGIINTGNPKHADVFLVTGSVNEQNKDVVKQIYEQMPEPKVVVAVGICACHGGVFRDAYNILGGVDTDSARVLVRDDNERSRNPAMRDALEKAMASGRIKSFGGPWAVWGSTIRRGFVSVNATRAAVAWIEPQRV